MYQTLNIDKEILHYKREPEVKNCKRAMNRRDVWEKSPQYVLIKLLLI